jgi:hypothetical protein
MRMGRITLSRVVFLAILLFLHIISQPARFCGKKNIEHKICALFDVQILSETLLILRKTQQDITINVHKTPCKVPVVIVIF